MSDPRADAAFETWWREVLLKRAEEYLLATTAIGAFKAGYAAAQRPIPVGERLPDEGQTVLALLVEPELSTYPWAVLEYSRTGGWTKHEKHRRAIWIAVSHWLPLPPDPTPGDVS